LLQEQDGRERTITAQLITNLYFKEIFTVHLGEDKNENQTKLVVPTLKEAFLVTAKTLSSN